MTTTLLLLVVIAAIAVLIAQSLQRRRPEAPTQSAWATPQQLDRHDFRCPDSEWLVVAFTSETCDSCASMVPKVQLLESAVVATEIVPYGANRQLHSRYGIDAVPTVVVADREGVVRSTFVGPATATDLWAAVAELREPGSTPPPEEHGPARATVPPA